MGFCNGKSRRLHPCGEACERSVCCWAERRIHPTCNLGRCDRRCPGFLKTEKELTPKAARSRPLPLRLEDWIDGHVFGFAKEEGWFNAITYYAIRDPRYQRAEVCWSECIKKWKRTRPLRYPSFEEWKCMAAECDETARLVASEQEARSSSKLVDPDRLSEAVSRYIHWEALAYWTRPALERCPQLPAEVVCELEQRCPGFLEANLKARERDSRGASQVQEAHRNAPRGVLDFRKTTV